MPDDGLDDFSGFERLADALERLPGELETHLEKPLPEGLTPDQIQEEIEARTAAALEVLKTSIEKK